MIEHQLKSWPVHFDEVLRGAKTCEVRRNDRPFQTGDLLRLREWDPETRTYTGRELTRQISHVGLLEWHGIDGFVALSLVCALDQCASYRSTWNAQSVSPGQRAGGR